MRFPEQQSGQKLLWQRPEHLLQPKYLAMILTAARRSGNRALLPALAQLPRGGELRVLSIQRAPFHGGVSGAMLERVLVQVEFHHAQRLPAQAALQLIFKRMALAESWLMRASGDMRCREVQLWRAGVLDDLPTVLVVPILAASYDEQTSEGALLMADVGRWLGRLESCFLPFSSEQQAWHLDHLARLHARFWGDARLGDASLGLASLERALLLLSPASITAQRATGDTHPYLAAAQTGWQAFFDNTLSESLRCIQRVFDHPAAFLASAAAMPPTLVHGDTWPPNMGLWHSEPDKIGQRVKNRTMLIDWALATAGPATFDFFWLLFYWRKVEKHRALVRYRKRLTLHLARRGIRLSAADWALLVDLGVVRTVLTCGETMGQELLQAHSAESREERLFSLYWWTNWAANIIRHRGWEQ